MENIEDQKELIILNLGYDETDHIKMIKEKIVGYLLLAENAAIISINGLTYLDEACYLDEPEGVVNLLMAKSAKNIRFAIKGLKLGYYSGASAILRSAYEDLSFAVLFHKEPSQIAKWLRNEFSDNPKKIQPLRAQQMSDARKAITSEEKESPTIIKAVSMYIKQANKHIHPSVIGLSEEFGIESDYFISDDMDRTLTEFKDNINKALENYVQKTSEKDYKPKKRTLQEKNEGSKFFIELPIRYDEVLLSDLALFGFYISHRILDYTKSIFGSKINNKDFFSDYQSWHKDKEQLE